MRSVRMFKSILEIDIGQRLLVAVAHNETGGAFVDRSGRREAARHRLFCSLLPVRQPDVPQLMSSCRQAAEIAGALGGIRTPTPDSKSGALSS
jgi:hypothetical protein